jgi:predicted  nucleic acid-binding Zn-ribbon protein
MTDEIAALWTLHGLDERLVAARTRLGGFAGEREAVERRLTGVRAQLEAVQKKIAELKRARGDRELEIEANLTAERRFQSQLPAVKKNEEYQALLHEIAGVKAKRSDLETLVLTAMEEEERAQAERPVAEGALKAAEQEAATHRAGIDRAEAEANAEVEAIQREREAAMAHLSQQVRSRYERIHSSRDGRAVVPIIKSACGGCFRAQPPQILQEARRGDRMLSCDGCGRLLVWPPDGA